MTYATTFSGIGGWELGLNACGWELKWQCERDEWCRRLLNERFGVPIYDDIRTICERNPSPVDALIGSPPCQPFSVAGAQCGTSDSRHLYPAFVKAVGLLKPRWVLMEQVAAVLSVERGRAFGGYIAGLATLGYDVLWHCLPACAVGAPHERDRVWIVAHSKRERREGVLRNQPGQRQSPPSFWPTTALDTRCSTIKRLEKRMGEPAVFRSNDGLSGQVDRLRGLGNAVVPQIPFIIGQAINQIESLTP